MLISRHVKLSAVEPLKTQSQNAPLGKIDAPFLFVFGGLAQLVLMPVRVEDGWNLAGEILGLIQKRRGLESGHNLVAEFTDPVSTLGLDGSQVFELRRRFHPSLGPTVENNVI